MTIKNKKVLVLGEGGREHAIAKQLSLSPQVKDIYVSPGNGGTAMKYINIDLKIINPFDSVIDFIKNHHIDLTVVGPEAYLVDGVVDAIEKAGYKVFGPSQKAAKLEGSKQFAKEIMFENAVPTSDYKVFTSKSSAEEHIYNSLPPYVLKADGLAAGKGVIIVESQKEAIDALKKYFDDKSFGEAGTTLIIESFLKGQEASILAFSDGNSVKCLKPSQDYKRAFDGDKGPNTGGMGAYTPVKILNKKHLQFVEEHILLPIIKGMKKRGIPYRGILYAGLMIEEDEINVVEFNCRFGDPETQCVLPLLQSDLFDIFMSCINGNLNKIDFVMNEQASVTVVMASQGYPGDHQKNKKITGLQAVKEVTVFHAGTVLSKQSKNQTTEDILTQGGRVLAVTALDKNLHLAISKSYQELKKIKFDGAWSRKDIGQKGL